MNGELPFESQRSRAVLFAVSTYPKGGDLYGTVDGPLHNVDALEPIVRNPQILGFERVECYRDPTRIEILSALESMRELPPDEYLDTLLVYYCGHGVKVRGDYFLTGTDLDAKLIGDTSINIDTFRQKFLTIPAECKILILDACYSASAFKKSLGNDIDLLTNKLHDMAKDSASFNASDPKRKGLYAIASAGHDILADADQEGTNYTAFSGLLINRLRQGFPESRDPRVSLKHLFDVLKAEAQRHEYPIPRESEKDGLGSWALIGNVNGMPSYDSTPSQKDPILFEHVSVLTRNLNRIKKDRDWMFDIEVLLKNQMSRELWQGFVEEMGSHLQIQLDSLNILTQRLHSEDKSRAIDADWQHFWKIFHQSTGLFHETLEFIIGVLLRDNLLYQYHTKEQSETAQTYLIADELILRATDITYRKEEKKNDGQHTRSPARATVPAQMDTRIRTLAGLIRFRFPGWTIWHLPQLGYEYSRIVLDRNERLTKILDAFQGRYGEMTRVRVLFADAMATYWLGPAYALQQILTTLDPCRIEESVAAPSEESATSDESVVITSEESATPDIDRAEVILNVLNSMNEKETDKHEHQSDPYKDVIERLRKRWETALRRANKIGDTNDVMKALGWPESRLKDLKEFAQEAWSIIDEVYKQDLPYPGFSEYEGWQKSLEWAAVWEKQLRREDKNLTPVRVSRLTALRDVFNAGWLCRLNYPEDSEKIARAMHKTCKKILRSDLKRFEKA